MQSSPIKQGNREDKNHFVFARAHTLRRRQNIDYTAAMGPNTKKYKSPHKRKIDERKRAKIQLTEEMTLTELHNEVHSKLRDLFSSGAMATKFL